MTTTYLDRIVEAHRAAAALDERPLDQMAATASAMPAARGFRAALASTDGLAVIAEVKRRSPSKGDLNLGLDPAVLAGKYQAGGASCLSVLTDEAFFGGSPADLAGARNATSLPVIRKDFTVCERDVYDAMIMGADCILLIVAALNDDELARFHTLAVAIGLDVLVETHDEPELERALAVGATLIGVNQRDLVTFEVDHDRAARMGALMPQGVVSVAESGVRDAADARRLEAAGYTAILVGETLVKSGDPAGAVRSLRGR
ncbi:MAG: indole-3-glycerol phosphate synthase TrpC [Acidimicrobiia bacterium]